MGEEMRRLGAVAIAVVLIGTACGGSDGGSTTTAGDSGTTTTAGGTTATTEAPVTTEAMTGGMGLIAQAAGFEGV